MCMRVSLCCVCCGCVCCVSVCICLCMCVYMGLFVCVFVCITCVCWNEVIEHVSELDPETSSRPTSAQLLKRRDQPQRLEKHP